jgi:hypothetical protein
VTRGEAARIGCLVLGLVAVFLTVGVPRRLAGDAGPVPSHAGANLGRLCRDHGGTPTPTTEDRGVCTVRYGRRVYLMDAITRDGFDEDTARYQRLGCEEARREERASTGRGRRRPSFVYHPTTGVCERTP